MTLAPSAAPTLESEPTTPLAGKLRHWLFGISPEEASFERRGFHRGDGAAQLWLEEIGRTFVQGYRAGLRHGRLDELAAELEQVEPTRRGFAYEGAAMALSLLDTMTPWKGDRFARFVTGPAAAHVYMAHVGVGWALARLGRRVEGALERLDPLLGWLAIDGYGFHEGYFAWPRTVRRQIRPPRIRGHARRVFDQGLGRSLWFVEGGTVTRIEATIGGFPLSRRADLWSGVGLAAAYAGGGGRAALESIRSACGPYLPHVAQGAAFAAKARLKAQNRAAHTELACAILCGVPAEVAARFTDEALGHLPAVVSPRELDADGNEPAYEVWRRRIQARFTPEGANPR